MNLFPCLVTSPDGSTFSPSRVVSNASGTTVYAWDYALGDARPMVQSDQPLEPIGKGDRRFRLSTGLGEARVVRLRSCACGHPMKRWQLPKPVRE